MVKNIKEKHSVINSISPELIEFYIQKQTKTLATSEALQRHQQNYIRKFDKMYEEAKLVAEGEAETINKMNEKRNELYQLVERKLKMEFNIVLTELVEQSERKNLLKVLYGFFIVNYMDNLIDFLVYYIYKNRRDLYKEFHEVRNSKDMSTKAFKKIYSNNKDAIVVTHLNPIVDSLIFENLNDEYMDFLSKSEDPKGSLIHRLIGQNKITSVSMYEGVIKHYRKNPLVEIIPKIRKNLEKMLNKNTDELMGGDHY